MITGWILAAMLCTGDNCVIQDSVSPTVYETRHECMIKREFMLQQELKYQHYECLRMERLN